MGVLFTVAAAIISAAIVVAVEIPIEQYYPCLGICGVLVGVFGFCIDREEK